MPGTHAEVRAANWMYHEIDRINPALYDPSKLTVVTYRLMPGPEQGLPFVACPNCASILPPEAYIPTGRLGQ
ncbi:YwqJ-related putative deaminase [Massilia genomosp. 1]